MSSVDKADDYKPVITPKKFFFNALRDHPLLSVWLFLGEFLNAIMLLLIPYAVRNLVDGVQGYDPSLGVSIWEVIGDDFYHFVFLSVMLIVISRFSGMSIFFLAPIIRFKPRMRMFRHMHNHDMGYFQDMMSGSLGNKISETTTGMALALWIFTYEAWPIFILTTASTILFFNIHIYLGLALAAWFVIYCPVIIYLTSHKAKISENLSRVRSYITGRIVDVAGNIAVVKAFANTDYEDDNLGDDMRKEVKAVFSYQVIREITAWFHYVMAFFLMVGSMYLAVVLYSDQMITIGTLAFVFTLILLIVDQTRGLSFALQGFVEHLGQMADGVNTIMTEHELKDSDKAKELKINGAGIDFNDVKFRYPDSAQKVVIDDLDLQIKPAEKIGLIGPSGAGKSTMVNLLLRFYDVQGGSIEIDKQNVRDITQQSLRRNIAYIPQDTTLFHRTLMENIRYGDLDAPDEKVISAAEKAHAHEFIAALPDTYETMVGERGVKLSGGQRQRIAIARAILKDAPILVLDEATSALDSESEQLIQESLKSLMKEKTVIAIAHRLSTIAHMDRLIVMNEGKIVEQGSHEELLALKGLYSQLWARQSGGFIGE